MSDVKKPGETFEYTQFEIEELDKCKKDFYYFTKYIYVVTESGEELLKLRQYQKEMIDIIKNNRFSVIMSSRQSGKCVVGDSKIWIYNVKTKTKEHIKISDFFEKIKCTFFEKVRNKISEFIFRKVYI